MEGVISKFAHSGAGAAGDTQGFYVQDEEGDVLKVVAQGAWVESGAIKIGNRVRIFFAKVQYGKDEYAKETTVWVFEDGYMHVLETEQPLKREGKTIAIGG